jgi:hypothetical protein
VTSGAPSARSMLTSCVLHGLALVLVMLLPAEAIVRNVKRKELDVVFHRAPAPVAVPVALPPPPPPKAVRPVGPRSGGAPPVQEPQPPPAAGNPEKPVPGPEEVRQMAEAQMKEKVGKAGILAFRDKLASLAQDKAAPRLGAEARYVAASNEGPASSHVMLATNNPGSSGGIDGASIGRSVGGGGGGGGGAITGLGVGKATSSIAGIGGGERPLAKGGMGASRTDEEIQIVMDRYKAQLYRLYNRALRNDPTLKGQMVLRMTIEPDGSVSMCKLQSSDMNAPELADQVVNVVKTINFGAKDVQALTISYPIDFLPAE